MLYLLIKCHHLKKTKNVVIIDRQTDRQTDRDGETETESAHPEGQKECNRDERRLGLAKKEDEI